MDRYLGRSITDPNFDSTFDGPALMNTFRIQRSLLDKIRSDLRRPHQFAFERIGFTFCKAAGLSDGILIIADTYEPIQDENYIKASHVGAKMNGEAIRAAMQKSLSNQACVFHTHLHDWAGIPAPSPTDSREWKKFLPDFFNATPQLPHGAIIVSADVLSVWVLMGKQAKLEQIARVEIVGTPLRLIDALA